jgi:secondary thiamine-phosphate synthase enzyme
MEIKTLSFPVNTQGDTHIIDITDDVNALITKSGIREGSALIFVPGSTAAVTTVEYEPGLLKDIPEFFEKIIPSKSIYHHDETWHDGNGYAHVRASLQGASLTIPFMNSKLLLGTWQQIILIDFDNRPRSRSIIIQLAGK